MDLGVFETLLQGAAKRAVPPEVTVMAGPPVAGPATGLRAEVFVHAVRYQDLGGVTADGARVARRPANAGAHDAGFAEERPARIVIEVTSVCAARAHMHHLCALVAPPLLLALETMPDPVLAALPDASVSLVFSDFTAVLTGCETSREVHDAVACHQGRLTFELTGFLHVHVMQRGGLHAPMPREAPAMQMAFDPRGEDLAREQVLLRNDTGEPIALGGWVLHDAAKRPHRFVFPEFSLAPGASVRVWTTRGVDDGQNLYWGRRQAVWTNTGDAAVLLAPDGTEVVRVTYTVPAKSRMRAPASRMRGKKR